MELPAHGSNLSPVRNHVAGGCPNSRTNQQNEQHPFRVRHEAFRPRDATHTNPEVVITSEKENGNQEGLYHPQPAHEPTHHRGAHLLVELVDFSAKPVASKGQYDERAHRDEIPDIAHPVVVRSLLISFR